MKLLLLCVSICIVLEHHSGAGKDYAVATCFDPEHDVYEAEADLQKQNAYTKECCARAKRDCKVHHDLDEDTGKTMKIFSCLDLKQSWSSQADDAYNKTMNPIDACCVKITGDDGGVLPAIVDESELKEAC